MPQLARGIAAPVVHVQVRTFSFHRTGACVCLARHCGAITQVCQLQQRSTAYGAFGKHTVASVCPSKRTLLVLQVWLQTSLVSL